MTDLEVMEAELLEVAVEDWCELWEVLAIARGKFPPNREEPALVLAQQAAISLVKRGLVLVAILEDVNLRSNPEGRLDIFSVLEERVSPTIAVEVLRDRKHWAPALSSSDKYVALTATDEGEAFYYETLETL